MSVRATLETAGDRNYRILRFDYEFSQPVDANCIPVAVPRGGFINFVIESPRHTGILAWMLGTDRSSAGHITVVDRDLSTVRRISFEGGHCIWYKEEYDTFTEDPMKIYFRVACQRIEINDQIHQQITWTENSSQIEGSSTPTRIASSGSSSESSSGGGVSSFNPND